MPIARGFGPSQVFNKKFFTGEPGGEFKWGDNNAPQKWGDSPGVKEWGLVTILNTSSSNYFVGTASNNQAFFYTGPNTGGLVSNTMYYVVDSTVGFFRLSSTISGTPISISSGLTLNFLI